MGCGGSKKTESAPTSKAPDNTFDKTLVKEQAAPAETVKPSDVCTIFLDNFRIAESIKPDESKKTLIIDNVVGGPIGMWNNRGRTEKVAKGDKIERVRKVQPQGAEWVSGDAEKMMSLLNADGVSEAEVRHTASQQPQEPAQPAPQPSQDATPATPAAEPEKEAIAADASIPTDAAPEQKGDEAQPQAPAAEGLDGMAPAGDAEPAVPSPAAEAETSESAGVVDAKDSSCGIFC